MISEAVWMHQQTACQKSSLRYNRVQKNSQKQLLTRPKSGPIDEFGGK